MSDTTVEHIDDTIDDLVGDFFYYGRKEDENLPVGEIEREVSAGSISADYIIERFANGVRNHLEGK